MKIRPEAGVRLVFHQGGHLYSAAVLDVSEQGLRAQMPTRLTPQEPLTEARLMHGDVELALLDSLRLERQDTVNDKTLIILHAPNKESAGALWRAMLALSDDAKVAPPPEIDPSSVPKIPAHGLNTESARVERVEWLQKHTGTSLGVLTPAQLKPERLVNNIENLIGAVEIPTGIAGPLTVHGQFAEGLCYLPMATTEGALIASVTRGAQALVRSGGVTCRVIRQQMTRVPLFVLSSLQDAMEAARWLTDHLEDLRAQVRSVSRHAKLVAVDPVVVGASVHARFLYETGDAAGQNMTTACTWQACQWAVAELRYASLEVERFVIEANMSGDKKVSFNAFSAGRGIRVVAEAVIPRAVLKRFLKVTPEQVVELNQASLAGAIQSGMVGYNINVANVIAGVFTATGQDIACVHESSVAMLSVQASEEGLYASLVLPCLVIGTVGGGTHLPQQRALLEMMGCHGAGKVGRLAEIITSYCLALELSTACAVVGGQFATAHERLGRNRPVQWLTLEELTPAFFESGLQETKVERIEAFASNAGAGILSELSARRSQKAVGLYPFRLHTTGGEQTDVMVKIKPLDEEVLQMMGTLASMSGQRVEEAFRRLRGKLEYVGSHTRELGVYRQTDPRFVKHVPKVFQVVQDDARESYVLVLEKLNGMVQMDAVDDISGWTRPRMEAVVRGAAALHAIWLGKEAELLAQPWLGHVQTAKDLAPLVDLYDAMANHAEEELPELMDPTTLAVHQKLIDAMPGFWAELEKMPRTLIHHDFNPRNIALRPEGDLTLVAYDWELATLGAPQRDLAEFLVFTLNPRSTRAEVDHFVELHRVTLEKESGIKLPKEAWRRGYTLSLYDLAVQRFSFYLAVHVFRRYGFLERAFRTLWHLIDLEEAS